MNLSKNDHWWRYSYHWQHHGSIIQPERFNNREAYIATQEDGHTSNRNEYSRHCLDDQTFVFCHLCPITASSINQYQYFIRRTVEESASPNGIKQEPENEPHAVSSCTYKPPKSVAKSSLDARHSRLEQGEKVYPYKGQILPSTGWLHWIPSRYLSPQIAALIIKDPSILEFVAWNCLRESRISYSETVGIVGAMPNLVMRPLWATFADQCVPIILGDISQHDRVPSVFTTF